MTQFKNLLLILFLSIQVLGAGSYFKGPGLIEGFTTITSAAGTTTLTVASETKQILTGSTTQTFVLPDATTLPLGRYFNMINKSSGIMTIQTSGGGALTTVDPGVQKEIHLRAAGSAAGTWDVLAGGGGGVWGSITGTLSSQTDLQAALDLKAPLASPTFTGTIGTPLTTSKLLATDASGNLTATAANSSQASYLDLTSSAQTQLNGKLSTSNYSAKGDLVAGVSSGVVAGVSVGSNGKVLVADSGATAGLRWDNATPKKNYVTNWNAEGGVTTGWSTYADAAGTSPVDCTGGSPNSTWAASASSAIHDSNNFLATLNTGASRQGEGVSYAFTVDSGDAPAMMSVKFFYKVAGGTFAAGNDADRTSAGDSDFTVWIYDVTNGTLIQPSTYRLYSNSTSVAEPFVSNFQTNSGSTSYRLCIHKGTSSTVSGTNITVRFDDFEISRSTIAYGTPISDWVSYTPTGSWSTNTTYTGRWRRVGDNLESNVNVLVSGAPTSATLTVNLPTGLSIDTAKLPSILNAVLGRADILDSGTQQYPGDVLYSSTTAVLIASINAGSTYGLYNNVTQAVPITFGASDAVQFTYSVPITGWSSSTQVSDGYDGRIIGLKVNSTGTTGTLNTSDNVVKHAATTINDTTASYSASTGLWTCPRSDWYIVSGSYGISHTIASGYISASIGVNGTIVADDYKYVNGAADSQQSVQSQAIYITAGQTVGLYSKTNLTTPAFTAASKNNWFSIIAAKSPQTMSATEVVAASYRISADKTPSVSNPIDYDTKIFDTHNAVTTGSAWKFTAPVQGLYRVTTTNATSTTGGTLDLYVNGSQDRGMMSMADTSVRSASATVSLLAGGYISINPDSASKTFTGTKNNTIYIERIK